MSRVALERHGTQNPGVPLQGFQLGAQLVHLPPFQLSTDGELRSSSLSSASLQDMGLLALYGRVYCYLHCRAACIIKLYRFYKCAPIHVRSMDRGLGSEFRTQPIPYILGRTLGVLLMTMTTTMAWSLELAYIAAADGAE